MEREGGGEGGGGRESGREREGERAGESTEHSDGVFKHLSAYRQLGVPRLVCALPVRLSAPLEQKIFR
jgi:hypothetical protein